MIPDNDPNSMNNSNYGDYQAPTNTNMASRDNNMQFWSSMQSNVPLVAFKPAGNISNSNLSELIDLNDIFYDEFYPPDVDYSQVPNVGYDFNNNMQYEELFSARYEATQLRQPQSDYILKGRDNVILIPPSVPKSSYTLPSQQSQEQGQRSSSSKGETDDDDEDDGDNQRKSKKRNAGDSAGNFKSKSKNKFIPMDPKDLSDYQRIERRERNREHAKRSRVRKKLLLDSLQDQLLLLRRENMALRRVVTDYIPQSAAKILTECTTEESSLLAGNSEGEEGGQGGPGPSAGSSALYKPSPLTSNIAASMLASSSAANMNAGASSNKPPGSNPYPPPPSSSQARQHAKILMEPDYRLIHSLIHSQQNFVLSDPSLPDNPIVYASDGFCRMTGYKKSDVLGRNCRFLQGPGTDQAAVDVIRKGIAEGRDISVCLLNYKADGKPFWNQFFLAALKDSEGQIVNYVGVQCEVNIIPVHEIKDRVKKLPIPADL